VTRGQRMVALGAALGVLALSLAVDRWAWRTLEVPGIYEKDWGRMLRVMGSLVFWLPLTLAVWLERRARDRQSAGQAWLLMGAPVLGGGLGELLKMVFRRERPGLHDGEWVFRAFTDRPFETKDLGLPSSHVVVAFAGAAVLARMFPRAAPVIYLLATGCAASRVLARAHFVSDAVVGALAGCAVGAVLWRAVGRSGGRSGGQAGGRAVGRSSEKEKRNA
jgi:membrane-associated phospholipid phosphatase